MPSQEGMQRLPSQGHRCGQASRARPLAGALKTLSHPLLVSLSFSE